MNSKQLKVKTGETFEEYRARVYALKCNGVINLTWHQIARVFNEAFGVLRDESTWRRECKSWYELEQGKDSSIVEDEDSPNQWKDMLLELRKERVKLSDERTQNNVYVRKLARDDNIIETIREVAQSLPPIKFLDTEELYDIPLRAEKEGIVQISDWHYGITVDNFLNKFNPEICISRIRRLLDECKEYFTHNPVKKIYVVNLGDLISGRIHTVIRLENRYDVITQVLHISEILAEFIGELSSIAPVEYYDCLDNHSRLEPDKKNSIDKESLVRIIPWYLRFRFEDIPNVEIKENSLHDDIISFSVMDGKWIYGGVHGHKDKPTTIVTNLTMMSGINFDVILSSHFHHFAADERHSTLLVYNGSLMGADNHTIDIRMSSKPSQNLLLVSEKTPLEDIHRVVLD